jgi:integrase
MSVSQRKTKPPAYRCQRTPQGNRAFVCIGRRRIYLGRYNSPESKEKYERVIAEHAAQAGKPRPVDMLLCAELAVRFLQHAQVYYRQPDGRTSSTIGQVKAALRPVRDLYASLPVDRFDLIALKTCRQTMIDRGLVRSTINRTTNYIKEMFRWGFENGIVPVQVPEALRHLRNLKYGRTTAPEGRRIRPVDLDHVEATKPHMTPTMRAMVEVQLLTGMRPGEVCMLRPVDIDMADDVWLYRPPLHKTSWRGKDRMIFMGPKSQEVIRPFLMGRSIDAYCFSPRQSEVERKAAATVHRRPNQLPTPRKTERRINDRFDSNAYFNSVQNACAKAFPVPPDMLNDEEAAEHWKRANWWTPNQLRHKAGTDVRSQFGLDAAQLWLGHSDADVTQVYAEVEARKGMEIARRIG